jgi:nicotinamide mononucleotide adenylyltransferase
MRIGFVSGSFKPYHSGHDAIIRLASKENDVVRVFYSTASKRDNITGEIAAMIIEKFVKKTMPDNVLLIPSTTPVLKMWQELQAAEEVNCENKYTIYADKKDSEKYSDIELNRYVPNLFARKKISAVGLVRGKETPDISASKMRQFLLEKDFQNFSKMLPDAIRECSKEIYLSCSHIKM